MLFRGKVTTVPLCKRIPQSADAAVDNRPVCPAPEQPPTYAKFGEYTYLGGLFVGQVPWEYGGQQWNRQQSPDLSGTGRTLLKFYNPDGFPSNVADACLSLVYTALMGGLLLALLGWVLWRAALPKPSTAVHPMKSSKHWSLPTELQQRLAHAATTPPHQAQALYRELTRINARTAEEKYVVGYAHYQIGKLYAEQKQFCTAQQAFRQLAEQRLSMPALPLDPSFGTWSEQGAYQAAICAYQLDPQQGIQQMIQFIEEHPDSPLVVGAYKRILRWTDEKPPAAAQRAWQKAQAAQKERMKRAAACGPKALAYVLRHAFGIEEDWQVLMKECDTELDGTSLWALAQAARKRGISAVGLEVSRKGLLEQEPPFLVWNPLGHYVAILERDDRWQVYDPETNSLQPWLEQRLPEEWRGAVLLLRPRTLAKQTNGGSKQ